MEDRQSVLLASIGGEPLAGSGFETEIPIIEEDESQLELFTEDQKEGDQ
jgi:hypothetical protein